VSVRLGRVSSVAGTVLMRVEETNWIQRKFSIAVAFLSTKLNMALILRHPLSAMATRTTLHRGPNWSTNIFLNQSILRSGHMNISTGRLFSSNGRTVQITYIDQGGKEHSVNADVGKSLMDIAHDNNIELEGKCSIQRMFSYSLNPLFSLLTI
jgi:hypothetical protein